MSLQQNVLLCYRGRYRPQVEALARKLRERGLSVTYDSEILTKPGSFDATDVGWISLTSDEAGENTTWRAPLKQAIGDSEVVVFLIDPIDQTENVFNEISWVAKAGRHAFVIFDTGAESVSDEAESIWVSYFNINYAIALRKFEVPGYEYLFLAHQDPREFDTRLEVVVNRVQEYLERVRHNPPPEVRLYNGVDHISKIEQLPLIRARRRLMAIQEEFYKRFGRQPPPHKRDSYEETLDFAYRYEKGAVVEDDLIRPPGCPFRYPRASEEKRFLRTQQIIERARPGKYEVPPVFAELARQAASIELILEQAAEPEKGFSPPVLLGTLPATAVGDITFVATDRDYAIIFVDRAFADFVYQTTKVSVRAWKLLSPPDELPVRYSALPADVAEVVQADPALEEGFFRSVRAYAVRGVPGASIEGAPPRAYQAPLTLLINTAERFMIGRGYAHLALMDPQFPALVSVPPSALSTEREIVLAKDFISASYVLASCAELDRTDPAMALQGCGMPVICADLVHRAVAALSPTASVSGTQTGPSVGERLAALERAYLAVASSQGLDPQHARDGLTPAHLAWQTPQLLWHRVARLFATERVNGAQPAGIWRSDQRTIRLWEFSKDDSILPSQSPPARKDKDEIE